MARDFAKPFYNSKEWIRLARSYRESHYYICERCGALNAREVHHKIHLTPENISNPAIALSPDNLELLCHECHYAEHHKEQAGRAYVYDDVGRIVDVKENRHRGDRTRDNNLPKMMPRRS